MNIFPLENPKLFIIMLTLAFLWTVPWKAMALWKSARHGQAGWFVLLLLVNTLGILEILYLRFFSRLEVVDLEKPQTKEPKPKVAKTNFLPKKKIFPIKKSLSDNPRKALMESRMRRVN